MLTPPRLSVIIPASNEEDWIGDCLRAVFASEPVVGGAEVIVVANGCKDATAVRARQIAVPEGWDLQVIETAIGSKPKALTLGDRHAKGEITAYLDADCRVSPALLREISDLLASLEAPAYASGTPHIPPARHWISRNYARFWQRLPFARSVAPGYGLYAVNKAGRARWGDFPDLIADDSFVRLQFRPSERHQVAPHYDWPVVEGLRPLVKVRRRQDAGIRQLREAMPEVREREDEAQATVAMVLRLGLRDPAGFLAYALVLLAGKFGAKGGDFTRGR